MTNKQTFDVIEAKANFDRFAVEDTISAILGRFNQDADILESTVPGVVAFTRIGDYGTFPDYQRIAAAIARETGHEVRVMANADWTFDDRCDEEATYVLFGIEGFDKSYEDEHRNRIYPVDPESALTDQAFEDYNRAQKVLDLRLEELAVKSKQLSATGQQPDVSERDQLVEMKKSLGVEDAAAVAALLKLDWQGALAAAAPAEPVPSP